MRWYLDRYGDEIEFDVATRTTYRLSMFIGGEESWETLLNLVEGFRLYSTSRTAAAMIADVELYEQHADEPERPPAPPEQVEESPELSALKTLIEQNQVVIHLLTKRKGAAKVRRMPRPETARDKWIRKNTRESFQRLEASFKFVSNEEFERNLREHGEQVVRLDGLDVHRGNRDARRRPVDAGLPPQDRGGHQDDRPGGDRGHGQHPPGHP
ncbi:hypothetical protein ACWEOE_10910 [Amycolatopsis sp. NPDC004368]